MLINELEGLLGSAQGGHIQKYLANQAIIQGQDPRIWHCLDPRVPRTPESPLVVLGLGVHLACSAMLEGDGHEMQRNPTKVVGPA